MLCDELKDNRFQKIMTSCYEIDKMLNGGVRIGNLTEIYGEAGTGKTQFCFQLCINVQMPESMGGLAGEALFVDCENCFSTKRLLQMAEAVAKEWKDVPNQFLDRIQFQRHATADELRVAVMFKLEQFLTDHPQVRILNANSKE